MRRNSRRIHYIAIIRLFILLSFQLIQVTGLWDMFSKKQHSNENINNVVLRNFWISRVYMPELAILYLQCHIGCKNKLEKFLR